VTRRNADETIRDLERKAATGDPKAIVAYARERLRRGLPVTAWELQAFEPDPRERLRYLIAADRDMDDIPNQIRARHEAAIGEINERAMASLRVLSPRIRRSRRRHVDSLEQWAGSVVGSEPVRAVMDPVDAERTAATKHYQEEYAEWASRRAEIEVLVHQIAWPAKPRRGDLETEFTFRATATHATVGLGAEGYARNGARDDAIFLASQGFDSRIERDPGRQHEGFDFRGGRHIYRSGDGYRVFIQGVLELLDAEILRLREDGWTYPSHYFGHDEYFRGSITEQQQRAWSNERFQALGWDPQPGRERDCCSMTVERMKQVYAERGQLKPSWLFPN